MVLQLPQEILENVFRNLPQSDQKVCLYVCRSWNYAIRPVLYHSVFISSRRQFKALFRTLCQSAEECRPPLGYLFRELRLAYSIGFSRAEFECLPKLCPFLTLIDFNLCLWRYLRYTDALASWRNLQHFPDPAFGGPNLCRSLLPNFRKCFTVQTIGMEQPGWHSFIKEMPYLQELSLIGSSLRHKQVHLSWIEQIHASLPYLQRLELLGLYLADDRITQPTSGIRPCLSVRSVRLRNVHTDLSVWVRYFAQKYPNMEELVLEQLASQENQKETYSAALALARSCPRIRSLKFVSSIQQEWPFTEFLEALHGAGARLFEIESSCNSNGVFQPQTLYSAIHCFQATLSILVLGFDEDIRAEVPAMIKALEHCSQLTRLELYLNGYGEASETFAMDKVPTSWPKLTQLTLSYFRIALAEKDNKGDQDHQSLAPPSPSSSSSSSSSSSLSSPHHALRCLKLNYACVDEGLFPYLSVQFPNLSDFSLWNFTEPSIVCGAHAFTIDISSLRLRFLEIAADGDVFRAVKLSQTDKTTRILERRRRFHGTPMSIDGKEEGWIRWYYSTPDPAKELCKLSEKDIQKVLQDQSYITVCCRSVDKLKVVLGE
ncbi:hypothetical protein EC973_008001 [Apophysomyces ossiformis]|uniref:F-box domain-containing protein n=1 Tax=Apophysomyces ossiformis TaxID=679940 RepID=A0A8H7BT80_9FUNG|nr:hypothetical protein EC973_008001 [Apophysomyces ossiformis]